MHHDRKDFIFALARELEAALNNNHFAIRYYITKGLADGHKSFDSPVSDAIGRLLTHVDEQLNR